MPGQYLLQNAAAWQGMEKPPSGTSLAGNGTVAGGGSIGALTQGSAMSVEFDARSWTGPTTTARSESSVETARSASPPVVGTLMSAAASDVLVPPHAGTTSGSDATTTRSKNRARALRGMSPLS